MDTQEKKTNRKENIGVVVSNKMQKTVTVKVVYKMRHPQYKKIIERSKKMYAHNESAELQIGQKVRIRETRPLSKLKRWDVVEVL